MANNDSFNGTTGTWDPAGAATALKFGPIQGITYENATAEVPITGTGDSEHSYKAGLNNESVTVDFLGNPEDSTSTELEVGTKGDLAVAWNDGSGTQGTISNCMIARISMSGSIDNPITSSITVRPSKADP